MRCKYIPLKTADFKSREAGGGGQKLTETGEVQGGMSEGVCPCQEAFLVDG